MANSTPKSDRENHENLDAALAEKFAEIKQDIEDLNELERADAEAFQKSDDMANPLLEDIPTEPPQQPATESAEPDAPEDAEPDTESAEENTDTIYNADDIKNTDNDTPAPEDTEPPRPQGESHKEIRARAHRRRGMIITTRIGDVVRIFTLGAILFVASIFLLVGTRPTESAEENRLLATFPTFSFSSLASGEYITDVMYYYEDTVPSRSFFKQLISDISQFKGIQTEDNVTFVGNVAPIIAETTPPTTTAPLQTNKTETTITTTTTTPEEPVDVGDGIVLVGDRAISVYGGGFSRGENYAKTLNAYKADLGENVNVYSLVAPTAVSFYLPDDYANYTASEIDNIDHINENLEGVIPVDAYAALAAHTDEDIYARTDHHWSPLGAYYAAEEFADTADVPFAALSSYDKITKTGYVGSMYTYTKSAVLQNNPENFTYYAPQNTYRTLYYDPDFTNEREGNLLINLDNVEPVSWYLVFMGGDERITHVSTDTDNNRTLVIIKDSYGNALVPCLTSSFSDIYVIDMRYFTLNAIDFIRDVDATDVLFAMNTFSATGSNGELLETIRTQEPSTQATQDE